MKSPPSWGTHTEPASHSRTRFESPLEPESEQKSVEQNLAGPPALPVRFGESADLIGYEAKRTGDQLTLITYWRVGDRSEAPLQLFAHALGADGSLVAQEDRLDVPAYGWRSGDLFAQINRLTLPDPTATVSVAVGFYEPDSGTRLPVLVNGARYDDRLWLAEVAAP